MGKREGRGGDERAEKASCRTSAIEYSLIINETHGTDTGSAKQVRTTLGRADRNEARN